MTVINSVQGATVLADAAGENFVGVELNALNVLIKHSPVPLLSLLLTQEIQAFTLAVDTVIDDAVITITSGAEPTDGNVILLKEGNEFYQCDIVSHAINGSDWDVTLRTPLDGVFTSAAEATEGNPSLAVNGSITPIEFKVPTTGLAAGANWHIEQMVAEITDSTAMDDTTFGGIASLVNGLLGQVKNPLAKNLFNIRTNGGWALEAFGINYSDKAGSGKFGFTAHRTYGKADLILDADTNDKISVFVKDDLTSLDTFNIRIQGHNHS